MRRTFPTQPVALAALVFVFALLAAAPPARAQSTATLQGTITDAQSAVMPGVTVTVRNTATGIERTTVTDAAGQYVAASLQPGHYQITAHLEGFEDQKREVDLDVAQTVAVNLKLGVAAVAENITVTGAAPLIDTATVSVGQVMTERTIQEIPLNGRHFSDLPVLMSGGITPPQNAGLSAPLRGQGTFSFISAGNRETSNNFMINGINLNDLSNSQVTFQPSINTVSEFKVENSTFSAEYGRNSGAIVNVATRSGVNDLHGEGFDYYRDDTFDSRNFFNPPILDPNTGKIVPKSLFNRKQFGLNLGGPIAKNRTFYFGSYEGLRHEQGVNLKSDVLSGAQRAAVTDPVSLQLLKYIPLGNSLDPKNGQDQLLADGFAPVNIDQYTLDIRHNLARNDALHGYYAFQRDLRQEPNAQGNTVPGFGDQRGAHRQVLTVNETHVFSDALVNEARGGFNRIHISFDPLTKVNQADLGINTGTGTLALPQITIQDLGLNIGGPAGFPSSRTVSTYVGSDTATYLRGNHIFKFGGEYRHASVAPLNQDPGTFSFPSVAAFQAGLGNRFAITLGDQTANLLINAFGTFVQDTISIRSNVRLDAGLRYDYIGSPTEPDNRIVLFDKASTSLVRLGSGINQVNKNGSDFQPRLGIIWNPTGDGRLAIRGAYAVMINQTNTGYIANSTTNPPLNTPLTVTRQGTATSNVQLRSAVATAQAAGLAPFTTDPNFLPGRLQTWNVNVEREIGPMGVMVGYFGSYGDRLRIPININQLDATGHRMYAALSQASPIDPGMALGNILEVESAGWSHYKGLWVTANRRMTHGLQFTASYTLSKSTDSNSFEAAGQTIANNGNGPNGPVQDANNIPGGEGPSDFDVRHRFSINASYDLPFHGNRLKEGWQLVGVVQAQSGNPFNITTNITTITGVGNVRPDLIGNPAIIGSPNQWFANTVCDPRVAGSCTSSSVFALPYSAAGVPHFGNLPRNALIAPGFSDTDVSLIKNVTLSGQTRVQLRVEVFNLFNQANLGIPGRIATTGSTSFGVINNTRFPTGDSGSARQVQFVAKVLF